MAQKDPTAEEAQQIIDAEKVAEAKRILAKRKQGQSSSLGGSLLVLVGIGAYLWWKNSNTSPVPPTPASATQQSTQDLGPAAAPIATAAITAEEVVTRWKTTSKGQTALEGLLWVPQIKFNLKNTSPKDADLRLRADFIDATGKITSDDTEYADISAGSTRGPIFLHGSVGYASDEIFLDMMKDAAAKWKVNLYAREGLSAEWHQILSETVQLPGQYQQMEEALHQSPTAEPGPELTPGESPEHTGDIASPSPVEPTPPS